MRCGRLLAMKTDTMLIPVRAMPKAARNAVAGVGVDDAGRAEVHVRVTVAPEGGKANKAICETLAKALGVSKSAVRVVRGETSRHKMVEVDLPEAVVRAWMDALPNVSGGQGS